MAPLELAIVAAWSFSVASVGGVAGLVLGNLRLPVILLFASSPAAGAGANLGISGAAAITAGIAHLRAERLNARLFLWMAPPSVAGGVAGGVVSGLLPSRVLLGVISIVVLYGAVELTRHGRRPRGTPGPGTLERLPAVLTGLVVGVLGGIVGLILGTLRLPAMLRWVGVNVRDAIGTNAAIGMMVGVGGVVGHLPSGVDWEILGVGAAASIPGALFGARLVGRLGEQALLRAAAAVLVISGIGMAAAAIFG